MAYVRVELVVSVALVAVLLSRAAAQPGCTTALMNLAPCLNYITGNSSSPSPGCCSQLSGVVQTSPQCLCSVLTGGATSIGIVVNQTLALSLPGACKVSTPPLSACQGANPPTALTNPPQSSPADTPDETPNAALTPLASDVPMGGGSKTVPKDGAAVRGGARAPVPLVLFLYIALSCSSLVTYF